MGICTGHLPNVDVIEYVIDGKNRRVGKKLNGTLVQGFLLEDQLRIAAELDGEGNVVSRFVYGEKVNVPEYMIKGGQTYRIVTDHLGSPRLVVDAGTGAPTEHVTYDESGSVLTDTAVGFQPFGFAGGLYDRDTKLVRFGVRDYEPQASRWSAKDPIRFKGGDGNLYGYAVGDLVNSMDPGGTGPVAALALFAACTAANAANTVAGYRDLKQLGDEIAEIRRKIRDLQASCPKDSADDLRREQWIDELEKDAFDKTLEYSRAKVPLWRDAIAAETVCAIAGAAGALFGGL